MRTWHFSSVAGSGLCPPLPHRFPRAHTGCRFKSWATENFITSIHSISWSDANPLPGPQSPCLQGERKWISPSGLARSRQRTPFPPAPHCCVQTLGPCLCVHVCVSPRLCFSLGAALSLSVGVFSLFLCVCRCLPHFLSCFLSLLPSLSLLSTFHPPSFPPPPSTPSSLNPLPLPPPIPHFICPAPSPPPACSSGHCSCKGGSYCLPDGVHFPPAALLNPTQLGPSLLDLRLPPYPVGNCWACGTEASFRIGGNQTPHLA